MNNLTQLVAIRSGWAEMSPLFPLLPWCQSAVIGAGLPWSTQHTCETENRFLLQRQVSYLMSTRIEHCALDRCVCLGQMDGKLILVMWAGDGRRILFWAQDFQDLNDEPNPVDTSGQIGVREVTCYTPRTSLWLTFGLLACDTMPHTIKRSLFLTTAYNCEYAIFDFKKVHHSVFKCSFFAFYLFFTFYWNKMWQALPKLLSYWESLSQWLWCNRIWFFKTCYDCQPWEGNETELSSWPWIVLY